MRACQLVEPEHYELFEIPIPDPSDSEVLVRIHRVAICGTDVQTFLGHAHGQIFPSPVGYSGHEVVGTVERPIKSGWEAGQPVLINPPRFNAFAEYLALPPSQLIPLPRDLPLEQLVLAQQLGTVMLCWRRMGNVVDKVVVVVGQGPGGLLFTALASHMGARLVVGVDVAPHRLALARRIGAHAVINADAEDPTMVLADLTGGDMADVAIEAVGKPETIDGLSRLVRVGGEMVFYGIPHEDVVTINFRRFFRRYSRTVTSAAAPKEPGLRSFRLAVDMIARNAIDVAPLVSHVLPLEQIQRGFEMATARTDGAVKVVMDATA